MKQQKDINLEVILNYNGIIQEQKKINQLLYFPLIIEKNIMQETIMIQFTVIQMKAQDLDVDTQKYTLKELWIEEHHRITTNVLLLIKEY